MTDDRLATMLRQQYELQCQAYGMNVLALDPDDRVAFIKDMILATTDELHEALNEVAWKPWSSRHGEVNDEAFFGELIDVVHFVMNLLLVAHPGLEPEALADFIASAYARKREVNIQRQKDGYDSITGKCPGCRRALDDDAVYCRRFTADEFAGPPEFYCFARGVNFYADGTPTTSPS